MIVIHDINKPYHVKLTADGETIELELKQLTYKQRTKISALTNKMESGELVTDSSMLAFYNLKYALKSIKGIQKDDGSEYELEFDDDGVSDKCLDEILNTPINHKFLMLAYNMHVGKPDKIINPVNGVEVEGIEIIQKDDKKKQ